jgi:plasmid stability protein
VESLLIRPIEPKLMKRLRRRAKLNGHSAEEEAHNVLWAALRTEKEKKRNSIGLERGFTIVSKKSVSALARKSRSFAATKVRPAIFEE